MSENLRVAVVGAGRMGVDHIRRLHHRIKGVEVAAVVDVDAWRAKDAIEGIDGASAYTDADTAFEASGAHAVVVATPGHLHEAILTTALDRDLQVLCEKPLTHDGATSWNVVESEVGLGKRRIQVGFMRRYDHEYRQLREIIQSRELGRLLMLHCAHRNPQVPDGYRDSDTVAEAVVHEFDVIRFLTGAEIAEVHIRHGRPSQHGKGLTDPQQVLVETSEGTLADVEVFMNAQFGYQVTTEAVFEHGVINIGGDTGIRRQAGGHWGGAISPGFEARFQGAYDAEFQAWADAARRGTVDGPTAWDGYAAAICCEAGIRSQGSGLPVKVNLNPRPALYSA